MKVSELYTAKGQWRDIESLGRRSYAPFLSFAAARAEHCGFGAMAAFARAFKERLEADAGGA